jgi:hypothetical protein
MLAADGVRGLTIESVATHTGIAKTTKGMSVPLRKDPGGIPTSLSDP